MNMACPCTQHRDGNYNALSKSEDLNIWLLQVCWVLYKLMNIIRPDMVFTSVSTFADGPGLQDEF